MHKHTPPARLTGICSHVFTSTQATVDHAGTAMPSSYESHARVHEKYVYPAHTFEQSSIPMWLYWFLPPRNQRCRPAMAG